MLVAHGDWLRNCVFHNKTIICFWLSGGAIQVCQMTIYGKRLMRSYLCLLALLGMCLFLLTWCRRSLMFIFVNTGLLNIGAEVAFNASCFLIAVIIGVSLLLFFVLTSWGSCFQHWGGRCLMCSILKPLFWRNIDVLYLNYWCFCTRTDFVMFLHRGLISPAKEKKEEKKSKLVRKFTRNKTEKYQPAPARAPGLAGLMETMRTQLEVRAFFWHWHVEWVSVVPGKSFSDLHKKDRCNCFVTHHVTCFASASFYSIRWLLKAG